MTQVILKRSVRKKLTYALVLCAMVLIVVAILRVQTLNKGTEMGTEFEAMTELGDKIGWLVPMTDESERRINLAKSLQFDGENKRYLSEALVDLLGFGSSCESINPAAADSSKGDQRSILILHSSPLKTELRDIIRRSWANPLERQKHGVVLRFVMGRPTEIGQVPVLIKESKTHGDILIGNFTDGTRSATAKSLLALRWAIGFCSGMDFFIQASDETFMWLDKLPKILGSFDSKFDNDESIVGFRSNKSRVVHNEVSPYAIKGKLLDAKEFYPPYCSLDAGIVMPFTLGEALYRFAWTTKSLVPFADALIGILADVKKWKVRHSQMFNLFPIDMEDDACALSTRFTARNPKDIRTIPYIWKNLKDPKYMKKCRTPDLDIIYAGIEANNVDYFKSVLTSVKDHSNQACKRDVFMVAVVSSHPESVKARQIIRDTWASKNVLETLKRKVKVFFLIGKPPTDNPTVKLQLDEEFEQYGDVLEGNFIDSFKNLTLKHLFGLTWTARNCLSAKYFFKSDDDVFANLDNVVNLLLDMNTKGQGLNELYIGNGGTEERNKMSDKNYHVSSDEYSGKVFPSYCVGGGYVLSMDLVPRAITEALRTPIISSLDDVYVGILMHKLGVAIEYHDGFMYTIGKMDKCSLRKKDFMVMHVHRKVDELQRIWNNFMDPTVKCAEDS